jgi:cardiolipin synthase
LLFFVAGLSDGLDGYLAKHNDWQSRLGSILDPLADKLLLVSSILALGWLSLIPLWLVIAVVARDIVIICGALAYHFLVGRYEMEPTWISKINTFFQIFLVLIVVFSNGFYQLPPLTHQTVSYIVLATTVGSGIDYVYTWSKKTYSAKKSARTR